jgi:predicted secreted Zn-dependent protease
MTFMHRRPKASIAIVAIVAMGVASGCATAPRNRALDMYPPGVSVRAPVVYYDVHGRTFDEIAAALRNQGPKIHLTSLAGETRLPIGWSFRPTPLGVGTCEITDIYLTVNEQILLPRWMSPADAEPGLPGEWTRFMTALETHEAGHQDILAKSNREIVDQIRGLSAPCSQITSRADDIARRVVDRASEAQVQYDLETRYGVTQGTTFGASRRGPEELRR